MNLLEPTDVIEIDLPVVAKQSLYLTILSLISLLAVHFLLVGKVYFHFTFTAVIVLVIGYLLLVVLHEFFHLCGFRIFAKVPWKRMKVGVDFKLGIAYATTDQLMTNKAIRKALLLPFWLTGVVPAIIALYIGSGILIILAALLIGGAAGDFAMYKALKKHPNHWLIKDDPRLPKLYVYSPTPIAEKDMLNNEV